MSVWAPGVWLWLCVLGREEGGRALGTCMLLSVLTGI